MGYPFVFRIWERRYREYLLSDISQQIHIEYSPEGHGPGCGLIVRIHIDHRREWRGAIKADTEALRASQDPAIQTLLAEEKTRGETHVLMHWWHVRPGQPLRPNSQFYPSTWVDGAWVRAENQGDIKWFPNNQIIAVFDFYLAILFSCRRGMATTLPSDLATGSLTTSNTFYNQLGESWFQRLTS